MARNLFSVPIFFIVFRETLEAAIIISVLLGLVEQIVNDDPARLATAPSISASDDSEKHAPDTLAAAAASNSADPEKKSPTPDAASGEGDVDVRAQPELAAVTVDALSKRRLIRKMRIQVRALSLPPSLRAKLTSPARDRSSRAPRSASSSPSPSAPPSSPSGSPRPPTSGPSPRTSGKVRLPHNASSRARAD